MIAERMIDQDTGFSLAVTEKTASTAQVTTLWVPYEQALPVPMQQYLIFTLSDATSFTWDITEETFSSNDPYSYKMTLIDGGLVKAELESTISGWYNNDQGNVTLIPD